MMWYHWLGVLVASFFAHGRLVTEMGEGVYHPKLMLSDILLYTVTIGSFWLFGLSAFMLGQGAVLFAWAKAFPT